MAETVDMCRVCGRPLTNERSVKLGIGPVCRRKRKRMDKLWDKCRKKGACKVCADPDNCTLGCPDYVFKGETPE